VPGCNVVTPDPTVTGMGSMAVPRPTACPCEPNGPIPAGQTLSGPKPSGSTPAKTRACSRGVAAARARAPGGAERARSSGTSATAGMARVAGGRSRTTSPAAGVRVATRLLRRTVTPGRTTVRPPAQAPGRRGRGRIRRRTGLARARTVLSTRPGAGSRRPCGAAPADLRVRAGPRVLAGPGALVLPRGLARRRAPAPSGPAIPVVRAGAPGTSGPLGPLGRTGWVHRTGSAGAGGPTGPACPGRRTCLVAQVARPGPAVLERRRAAGGARPGR
jgi:hypothetical protein